jgi:Fur family ferric uptake transcriptional regulator
VKISTLNYQDASKILRNAGLRSTPARRAIIEILAGSGPLREEEIASRMGTDTPDTATLYRCLDVLVEVGLVKRHHFGERAMYFSLHLPDEESCEHAHFVCESCGHAECLTDTVIEKNDINTGDRLVHDVELVINGICNKCRKK